MGQYDSTVGGSPNHNGFGGQQQQQGNGFRGQQQQGNGFGGQQQGMGGFPIFKSPHDAQTMYQNTTSTASSEKNGVYLELF